ncbi:hypothetical protein Bca4012_052133 [Brassica carinata]
MISDQATTIHVDSQETKNKVKLGLVDWFVDQPFSSKSFSSFNPLEKGFSRYHSSGQSLSEWNGDKNEFWSQGAKVFGRCESSQVSYPFASFCRGVGLTDQSFLIFSRMMRAMLSVHVKPCQTELILLEKEEHPQSQLATKSKKGTSS